MPRLTITLPNALYNRLSGIALQSNDSMSSVINRLISIGMHSASEDHQIKHNEVEQHCQQLIIQMNALVKNMSSEILKFSQDDFEQLRQAAVVKYHELVKIHQN
jgi:hypothetical protein